MSVPSISSAKVLDPVDSVNKDASERGTSGLVGQSCLIATWNRRLLEISHIRGRQKVQSKGDLLPEKAGNRQLTARGVGGGGGGGWGVTLRRLGEKARAIKKRSKLSLHPDSVTESR